MQIKTKNLSRVEWYNDSERDFKYMYHKDDWFSGAIGLITFTGLKTPEMITNNEGDLCIADNGYKWIELVPENKNWALTSMINDEGKLFQFYFDITKENTITVDGNATFKDVFLDVVAAGENAPIIIDEDELEEAFSEGLVTREEYDLFYKTANEIVDMFSSQREYIIEKLYSYVDMFIN